LLDPSVPQDDKNLLRACPELAEGMTVVYRACPELAEGMTEFFYNNIYSLDKNLKIY